MSDDLEYQHYSLKELCQVTQLPSTIIIEIVEQGIIAPEGAAPENWSFDTRMITVTKKAWRLHNDLDIDWSGIALAIDLIDELEQIRHENELLKNQLRRFLEG